MKQVMEEEIVKQENKIVLPTLLHAKTLLAEPSSFRYRRDLRNSILNAVYRKFLEALEARIGPLFVGNNFVFQPGWEDFFKMLRTEAGVYAISQNPVFTDEIKMYFFDIFLHPGARLGSGHRPSHYGFGRGVSDDYSEAVSKVFGEFLERYALLYYEDEWFLRASISQLTQSRNKFLHPKLFASFGEEQSTWKSNQDTLYNENALFRWISVRNLATNEEILAPAQFVFWTYCRHHADYTEPRLTEPNTNGAGAYFTREGAVLSGLYELIQRDAFFLYWFNSLSPKKIDLATITNPRLAPLLEQAKRLRIEVVFLDITSDFGIPAVVCALLDHSGVGPKVAIGAGCGQNPDEVLRRAFTEACGLQHWMRDFDERYTLPDEYEPFSNSWMDIGQMERLLMWANPEMFPQIEFLFKGEMEPYEQFAFASRSFPNEKKELSWLIQHLSSAGYESFCYESTHPILKKTGYFSVQAIVPGLIPLYLHEMNAPLGAKRIQEGVERMGKKPADSINTLPHPFP